MKTMSVEAVERILRAAPLVLLSGPVETRLAHEFCRPSPGGASFVQLFDQEGRAALRTIYAGYIAVAGDHGLPMVVDTPTWRAHPDELGRRGFTGSDDLRRVNGAAVEMVRAVRRELDLERSVAVAGTVGPRHEGYSAARSPAPRDAESYHRPQVEALVEAGVDLLYAPTFPSVDELIGVARAFAATSRPYVLAPTIDASGCLPDGCPLDEAADRIRAAVMPGPSLFAVGCVHPATLSAARGTWDRAGRSGVAGIAANGSDLDHEALDGIDHVVTDPPSLLAERLAVLHRGGLRLIGGCCGTDDTHLRAFAERVHPRPEGTGVGHRPEDRNARRARAVAALADGRDQGAVG